MDEAKMKHLEFLQGVITRMNANSFFIKGWTITLIAALFALAAKDANVKYVLIAYVVIPASWILDGFFLSNERQYRALYDKVRKLSNSQIDFGMNAKEFATGNRSLVSSTLSATLILFYGITISATLIVMFVLYEPP